MVWLFDDSCLLAGLRRSFYTFDLPSASALIEHHILCFNELLLFLDLVL